jgi:hypothetical protein
LSQCAARNRKDRNRKELHMPLIGSFPAILYRFSDAGSSALRQLSFSLHGRKLAKLQRHAAHR